MKRTCCDTLPDLPESVTVSDVSAASVSPLSFTRALRSTPTVTRRRETSGSDTERTTGVLCFTAADTDTVRSDASKPGT